MTVVVRMCVYCVCVHLCVHLYFPLLHLTLDITYPEVLNRAILN